MEKQPHFMLRRNLRRRTGQNNHTNSNREIVDLISGLPDDILQQILSFLPIEEAIRTSVLSKRWVSVWPSVPTLAFYHKDSYTSEEFATFVDKTLIRYKSPKLKKFLLFLRLASSKNSKSLIDEWVRFATLHDVEELSLYNYGGCVERYMLPSFLCDNSILVKLHLESCGFVANSGVSWTSLKVLSIEIANLSDDVIDMILSGSPVLEYLGLHYCDCRGLRRINITSRRLRELVIRCVVLKEDDIMEIWGPHLKSLTLKRWITGANCRLIDVSSLVEANLNFRMRFQFGEVVKELLEKLPHVEKLTLGFWCIQVIMSWEVKDLPSIVQVQIFNGPRRN